MAKTQEEMDESPASVIAITPSGGKYDINNIPGKLKKQLILEGEADVHTFAGDGDNIPGKKRASLIAAREEALEKTYAEFIGPNTFKVGDVVQYKKHVSEVTEVDEKQGIKIILSNGKPSKWVHHSLVKKYEDEKE